MRCSKAVTVPGDPAAGTLCVRKRRVYGGSGSAWVAQLVERVLGKDEVTGSIPVPGSRVSEFFIGARHGRDGGFCAERG